MDANKLFQRNPDIYVGRFVGTAFDGEGATVTPVAARRGFGEAGMAWLPGRQ